MVKRKTEIDFKKVLDELDKKVIKVGYFSNSHYTGGLPIALVAATHEYGSMIKRIPPRPTLSPALHKNQAKYQDAISRAVIASLKGTVTISNAFEQIAELAAADVYKEISELTTPILAKKTVEERRKRHSGGKASDKPLVDTGAMMQAVSGRVEDK